MENNIQRHSSLGIASLVLGLVSAVMLLITMVLAANVNIYNENELVILGLFVMFTSVIGLTGAGTGIAGMCMTGVKKVFAFAGTTVSAIVIFLIFIIMIIGNI